MAIEHMDNFSWCGTGNPGRAPLLAGVYAQLGSTIGNNSSVQPSPDGQGTSFYYYADGLSGLLRYVLQTPTTTIGVGGRYWVDAIPASVSDKPYIISFRNASNVEIASAYIGTVGNIVVQNAAGTIIGNTVGPVLTASAFYHIETKIFRDAAAGTIEIRVEGITVLSINTLALGVNNIAQVAWISFGSNTPAIYVKDVVVWNGLGTHNNDFMGSCVVYSLIPDADVALNWTPSTGTTGYTLIDEGGPPVGTDYIEAGTPAPSPYIAGLTDLPPDVTSIRAVMSLVRARKTDGGDGNLQVGFISGADTQLGIDRPITAAFTYWRDFSEEDPVTDAPWIPAAIDAMNWQLNRTV